MKFPKFFSNDDPYFECNACKKDGMPCRVLREHADIHYKEVHMN